MKTVIVAGDLVCDHNMVEYPTAPSAHHEPFTRTVEHPRLGGAWYLEDLVKLSCADQIGTSEVTIAGPQRPSDPIGQPVATVGSAHVLWTPFSRKAGDKKAGKVWRIAKFLGCQRPKLDRGVPRVVIPEEGESPDLLVLDDLSLGFKRCDWLWPKCLGSEAGPRSVVLKLSSLPDESPLFQYLATRMPERLTVVLSSRLLRLRGAAISEGLSWDRTIEETVEELEKGRSFDDLARCRRVIVHFRNAGAASFTRCRLKLGPPQGGAAEGIAASQAASGPTGAIHQTEPVVTDRAVFERFLYHPDELEGTWESIRPGQIFGTASILTAVMARHELCPNTLPLYVALGRGLAAARISHERGGGSEKDAFNSDAAHDEIQKCLHPPLDPRSGYPPLDFFTAFPHAALSRKPLCSQPAGKSDLLRDLTGCGLEYTAAKAMEVVLYGADKALKAAPKARYGKYFTVDREEIERINSIARLFKTYLDNPVDTRPLSIAVFGPPGSGKSFAIKQLAEQMMGKDRDPLEFNLSQFGREGSEQLLEALHQVHDETVRGRVPLVFWDEFDVDELRWLEHFLSPMQDGMFRAAGHLHPLAKAIFVFAGGTKSTFDEFDVSSRSDATENEIKDFKKVKGPDFVSRLRGFVNIKGPNPTGDEPGCDPAHLIRRATLLRSTIERFHEYLIDEETGLAAISTSLIRGFLRAGRFRHGARSLESLVAACDLRSAKHFGPAELPPSELLRLHVTGDFLDRVKEGELEAPLTEKLATAIHEAYLEIRKPDPSDVQSRPYPELPEPNKEMSRASARVTQAKFHEVGYSIERCSRTGRPCGSPANTDPADRQALLEIEHDRWMREKLLAGFEWAEKKNAFLGQNPDIALFKDVPPGEQELDAANVDAVCRVLSEEGYRPVKRSS